MREQTPAAGHFAQLDAGAAGLQIVPQPHERRLHRAHLALEHLRLEQDELFGDIAIDYIEGSGDLRLEGDDALTSVGEATPLPGSRA